MRRCTRGSIDDQASVTTSSTTMESPDNDSAFESDDISLLSSESSASSGSGMINGARWLRQVDLNGPEADGRKFFVNIYCADGSTKEAILIDSQMTVSTVLWLMSERSHVQCHEKWGLVEYLPELNIERCLEDHEKLFETLLQWKPKSENRIIFSQRLEKYDVFQRPEKYLPNSESNTGIKEENRLSLLQAFFSSDVCKLSQADGLLWTKVEGKKSWKKHLFVLRDGNLFQATKCKKGSTQDFVLVANIKFCRVYWATNWKKKLKSPNDFGFALTPPKVQQQEKDNVCIRYLCAEDEMTRHRWTTLFRLAQTGRQLAENFCHMSGQPSFLPPKESKDPKPVLTVTNPGQHLEWHRNVTNGTVSWPQDFIQNGHQLMHRSDSELSSCCHSEVDSSSSSAVSVSTAMTENGFDTDHHEGGTIRRKPVNAVQVMLPTNGCTPSSELPPPPPPEITPTTPLSAPLPCLVQHPMVQNGIRPSPQCIDQQQLRQLGEIPRQLMESDMSLNSLPPPPEELRHLHRIHSLTSSTCEHHLGRPPVVHADSLTNGHVAPTVITQPQMSTPLLPVPPTQLPIVTPQTQLTQIPSSMIQNHQVIHQPNQVPLHVQQQQVMATPMQNQVTLGQMAQPQVNVAPPMVAIREELYPCGIPRAIFQPGDGTLDNSNQMDLLKRMPNNPPPNPFSMPVITRDPVPQDLKGLLKPSSNGSTTTSTINGSVDQPAPARRRRITFNELVHSLDDDEEGEWHQLKSDDVTPTPEDPQEPYGEKDVSNWVLQSLKHCRLNETPSGADPTNLSLPIIAHELRPKIYNGRSVPNCFPPSEEGKQLGVNLNGHILIQPSRKIGPPPPPKRSQNTQLTSPT